MEADKCKVRQCVVISCCLWISWRVINHCPTVFWSFIADIPFYCLHRLYSFYVISRLCCCDVSPQHVNSQIWFRRLRPSDDICSSCWWPEAGTALIYWHVFVQKYGIQKLISRRCYQQESVDDYCMEKKKEILSYGLPSFAGLYENNGAFSSVVTATTVKQSYITVFKHRFPKYSKLRFFKITLP